MLKICSSVMVTGCNEKQMSDILLRTKQYDIKLDTREVWVSLARTNAERFICTPLVFTDINPALYPITVMLVDEDTNIEPFLSVGITRFITDLSDDIQFLQAMYVEYEATKERKRFTMNYLVEDYRFYFTRNEFYYKGEGIYLLPCEKKYLYDWLIFQEKDNKKRIYLFNIRKRLNDKTFLKNINRYGEVKQ